MIHHTGALKFDSFLYSGAGELASGSWGTPNMKTNIGGLDPVA
jgi:hypothetical protein